MGTLSHTFHTNAADAVTAALAFDGGEMARRVAAFDWSATPLGPPAGWPEPVRVTVAVILRSPVALVTLWGERGIMIYNDAYAEIAGGRHPEILGCEVRKAWPEVADFNDRVMRVGLGGGTLSFEDQELTLHRSGRPEQVWLDLDYSPIIGEGGTVHGVIAVVTETTQKVQAERRLRVAADSLAALNAELERHVAERTAERDRVWRNSRDVLAVLGPDGRVRDVNPAWTDILGHDQLEVLGRPLRDFAWPDESGVAPERPGQALGHQALGGPAVPDVADNIDIRYRHRDGSPRWISWNTSSEGDLLYAYGRDVTGQREQAEALLLAEEQLRQAQKMEAVGQLTGGLAHDFNNLLTGIAGSLERLESGIKQGRSDDLARYITAARDAAERAASLTHRLLAFSRRQTLDPTPTGINRLVVGMEELIRRTVGPSVDIEVAAAADLWTTMVDPNQLENALLNLCINARDAMPDGGKLTIETANCLLDTTPALQRGLPAGEYVSLSVSDTGTGMTPEVAKRAFDPFFTTKPIGMGTGLGLSMIYGFVRQSGGQARLYSEPGRGTTVRLYLPRNHGEAEMADSAPIPALQPRAEEGETVLVLDDEPTVRMLIADVLDELGYATLEAAEGASALRILRSDRRVDLLVTDVGLPGGMNGRQVADAARQLRPGLKVLFVTGYAENALIHHGHLEKGMHVMTKPFAMEAVASRIKAVITGA